MTASCREAQSGESRKAVLRMPTFSFTKFRSLSAKQANRFFPEQHSTAPQSKGQRWMKPFSSSWTSCLSESCRNTYGQKFDVTFKGHATMQQNSPLLTANDKGKEKGRCGGLVVCNFLLDRRLLVHGYLSSVEGESMQMCAKVRMQICSSSVVVLLHLHQSPEKFTR